MLDLWHVKFVPSDLLSDLLGLMFPDMYFSMYMYMFSNAQSYSFVVAVPDS